MELYIESLTGTCFELIVSPYETILSVKTKIQRLEGIPISQQYLIWQESHLEDDYCLKDYGITGGCTLKLVLAMRGGPINTRRVGIDDDNNVHEMTSYIDSSHEDLFDKLSPPPSCNGKNSQVTLLVYRDGDQLNFFRVVDRGDGTLTPFSESLSDSTLNARDDEDENHNDDYDDDDDDDDFRIMRRRSSSSHHQLAPSSSSSRLSLAKIFENSITATKMKQVRNRMKNISLHNKVPAPPQKEKPSDVVSRRKVKGYTNVLNDIEKKNKETEAASIPEHLILSQLSSESGIRQKTPKPDDNKTPPPQPQPPPLLSPASSLARISRLQKAVQFHRELIEKRRERTEAATALADHQAAQLEQAASQGNVSPSRAPGFLFNRHELYLRSYGLMQRKKETSFDNNIDNNIGSSSDVGGDTAAQTSSGDEKQNVLPPVFTSNRLKQSMTTAEGGEGKNTTTNNNHATASNKILSEVTGAVNSKVGDGGEASEGLFPFPPPPSSSSLGRVLSSSKLHPQHTNKRLPSIPKSSAAEDETATGRHVMTTAKENFLHGHRFTTTHRQHHPALHSSDEDYDLAAMTTTKNPNSSQPFFFRQQSLGKSEAPVKLSPIVKNPTPMSSARIKPSAEAAKRQEAREVIDFINKTVDSKVLRKLVSSPVKDVNKSDAIAGDSDHYNSRQESSKSKSRCASRSALLKHMSAKQQRTSPVALRLKSPNKSQHLLPPVKKNKKKQRCYMCGKRTGLATSYMCRCGYNFCAVHRYAEAHSCTFDYKAAGRKVLEAANPLVRAPKLPKI